MATVPVCGEYGFASALFVLVVLVAPGAVARVTPGVTVALALLAVGEKAVVVVAGADGPLWLK